MITVAGVVTSTRGMVTREKQPFISAVLEDLDGKIPVMVWPRVYNDTKDLWQEGSVLLVEGRVRVREDEIQLNCESARRYQPREENPETEAPAPVVEVKPPEVHRLTISLTQTDDKESDIAKLHRLDDILKGFPGPDRVFLRIVNGTKVYNLDPPTKFTGYSPQLEEKIKEVVGKDSIRLDKVSS